MNRAFLLLFLLFIRCAPDASSKAKQNARLQCETTVDEAGGNPFGEVFLLYGEQKIKVAETTECESIHPASFPDYAIPSDALSACGGRHIESGSYFFLIRDGATLRVFQSCYEEGQEMERFHYVEIFQTSP